MAPGGGASMDVYVAKLNPAGSGLVYATYLGGIGWDWGTGVAIDQFGNAYVAGMTNSDTTFPLVNAYQTKFGGGSEDAFVAKLNPSGSALVYSTFLGGDGIGSGEGAYSIAVNSTAKRTSRG